VILALLSNSDSGAGGAPEAEELLRALGAEVRLGGSTDALEAAAAEADRIVVAGGDGSVAPAAAVAGTAGLPLAVVPCGTANDFARAMGLPQDVEEACRLAARGERLRTLELGHMGERPFVNVASGGLAAVAARRADPLKKRLRQFAYLWGAVRAGMSSGPWECRVRCDGQEVFSGGAWQVIVAGSGAFGGGSEIDAADPADGRLDVTVIPAGSRLRLAQRAAGMRSGSVTEQRGVVHARGRSIEVDGELEYNVDGEIVAESAGRFGVSPAAFRLVVG
jgi:YegS/Rv2252/BmrU family lipid kinase